MRSLRGTSRLRNRSLAQLAPPARQRPGADPYAGLPGNAYDEIRLAMATDDDAQYRAGVLTNGQTSGTVTFTASVVGSYVVRAHINGTTNVAARSAVFTVTN